MDISVQHVAVSRRRKEPNITAVRIDDIRLEPAEAAGRPLTHAHAVVRLSSSGSPSR